MFNPDNPRSGFRSCCVTASRKPTVHVLNQGHTHTHISTNHLGWHLVLWFHSKKAKGLYFSHCYLIKASFPLWGRLWTQVWERSLLLHSRILLGTQGITIEAMFSLTLRSQSMTIFQSCFHYECCISSHIINTYITQICFQNLLPDKGLQVRDCVILL